jgi:hypothetical protein
VIDERAAPKTGPLRSSATPARDEAHRRSEPAGEKEARPERAPHGEREVPSDAPGEIGRLAEPFPQLSDGARELAALELDVVTELLS